MADALYGTAPFVDGASVTFAGVQVISQIRSNQKVRLHKREQHVADYFATHPGTPHTIRIRGGEEVIAIVGSARVYVCSHKTKRFVVALKYAGEETYRSLIASDLSWRTLDMVQGQTLRWLVEIFQPYYDSSERLSLTAACGNHECISLVKALTMVSTSAQRSVRRGCMFKPDTAPPRLRPAAGLKPRSLRR